jgi:hypothetical protein
VPGEPGIEPGSDAAQGEDLGAQPGGLHLAGEMGGPGGGQGGIGGDGGAQDAAGDAAQAQGGRGNGGAVVALGVERGFGQHGAGAGALEDEGGAVRLVADKMGLAVQDQVHDLHLVAGVEQRGAGGQRGLGGLEAAEQVGQGGGHDRDHVGRGAGVASPPRVQEGRVMLMRAVVLVAVLGAAGALVQGAGAQGGGHRHGSPYAGQEARALKNLSAEDVAELRRGGGWGLAKVAELNGVPGPKHVLEMSAEIGLSAAQVAAVTAVFTAMQRDAQAEGGRLIALEEELEAGFRARAMDAATLSRLTAAIGESHGRLRLIHLSAHLATPGLLSDAQVALYNRLRGYDDGPCARVPAGHDAAMWRRHNGCK